MHGNAWEWCLDALVPYPPDRRGPGLDDPGATGAVTAAQSRVLRGGSFTSPALLLRSACRFEVQPTAAFLFAGLRVARTLPPEE